MFLLRTLLRYQTDSSKVGKYRKRNESKKSGRLSGTTRATRDLRIGVDRKAALLDVAA
jgi:hypothetical protein